MARVDRNAMTVNYTILPQPKCLICIRCLICVIYSICISEGIVHANSERPKNITNSFYFLMGLSHFEITCNAVKREARKKCGKKTLIEIC